MNINKLRERRDLARVDTFIMVPGKRLYATLR
jgi:hypothetical protein